MITRSVFLKKAVLILVCGILLGWYCHELWGLLHVNCIQVGTFPQSSWEILAKSGELTQGYLLLEDLQNHKILYQSQGQDIDLSEAFLTL